MAGSHVHEGEEKQEFLEIPAAKHFHALAIGINEYEHHANLRNAVNDTNTFCDILESKYGFPEENVIRLIDKKATAENIDQNLQNYKVGEHALSEDDYLVVWMSGHGIDDEEVSNRYYFVPHDGSRTNRRSWIDYPSVRGYFSNIEAAQILLISDSCFSGGLYKSTEQDHSFEIESYSAQVIKQIGRHAISSGRKQRVWDRGMRGHSLFSYSFLNALRENEKVALSTTELYENFRNRFKHHHIQTPDHHKLLDAGHEGGEFVFFNKGGSDYSNIVSDTTEIAEKTPLELEDLVKSNNQISNSVTNNILDFKSYCLGKTQGFVGREWILDEIDAFLHSNASGCLMIVGEPGIGKSSIMSHLIEKRNYIHHFNIALKSINTASQFLQNVCAQLIERFQLTNFEWPKSGNVDGLFFEKLLWAASAKATDEKVVIAIDALDEVQDADLKSSNSALFIPSSLPDNIYFIITSRPKKSYNMHCDNIQELKIHENSPNNIADIKEYVRSNLSQKEVAINDDEGSVSLEEVVEILTLKSEGNFMYLFHVLPEIRKMSSLKKIENLPQGLLSYYENHWQKMQALDPKFFDAVYKPVVCLLASVREPVSIVEIGSFADIGPDIVARVVKDWREFLDEEVHETKGKLYRVYHRSFQDFLQTEVDPDLRTYKSMIFEHFKKLKYAGN